MSGCRKPICLIRFIGLVILAVFIGGSARADSGLEKRLEKYLGPGDSLLVTSHHDNRILFSRNSQAPLIPASIIKIITSLLAFEILGEDFRFETDFFLTPSGDLVIKGFGDPGLVSGEISVAAGRVAEAVPAVGDIVVDDSFFAPVVIPGRANPSRNPYNAPNGALCVNFNTVTFSRENDVYRSAEPETPLLPFAEKRLRQMPVSRGRVLLTSSQAETALYAGELFAYFLAVHGCSVSGRVRAGLVDPSVDRLVYRHQSGFSLPELVSGLLFYSTNFTANQLLLTCGAVTTGPPATLAAGVEVLRRYLEDKLDIFGACLEEGAGLSRRNRITAAMMDRALVAFMPYHGLLRQDDDGDYYKTGSLSGVSTRAGYVKTPGGNMVRYVIMINTPGKSAERIIPVVKEMAGLLRRLEPSNPCPPDPLTPLIP